MLHSLTVSLFKQPAFHSDISTLSCILDDMSTQRKPFLSLLIDNCVTQHVPLGADPKTAILGKEKGKGEKQRACHPQSWKGLMSATTPFSCSTKDFFLCFHRPLTRIASFNICLRKRRDIFVLFNLCALVTNFLFNSSLHSGSLRFFQVTKIYIKLVHVQIL